MFRQQNRAFSSLVRKLESEPVCQRQSLKSFLVLPFQRITRIKLILEVDSNHTHTQTHTRPIPSVLISFQNILKLTEPGSDTIGDLEGAVEAIHEVISPLGPGGAASPGLSVTLWCSDSGQLRRSGEEDEAGRGADLPGRSDRLWQH